MKKEFDLNTDNNDKKAVMISILESGVKSDFWKIILEGLKENKKHLDQRDEEEMKLLPADQYKFESELIKVKVKFIDKLSELPKLIKESLESEESKPIELDPYK